jgi:hypothetical protein
MDLISLGVILAAMLGGVSMGVYFAAFHDFSPPRCSFRSQLVSMLTVGYSFLVPLAVETAVFEGGAMGYQWFGVFAAWAVFAFASTATNYTLSNRKFRLK